MEFLISNMSKKSKWLNLRPRMCLSFSQIDLLCMQSPSVQFLDCKTRPSQSLPPFLGAGAVHSLLRQCVHSVPQVDHLLHEVHLPSTATHTHKNQQKVRWRSSYLWGEGSRAHVQIKQNRKPKKMPHQGGLHSCLLLGSEHGRYTSSGFYEIFFLRV